MVEIKKEEDLLESGSYFVKGSLNGNISIDTIELHSNSGQKRIWKVRNITAKEIILDVIKF